MNDASKVRKRILNKAVDQMWETKDDEKFSKGGEYWKMQWTKYEKPNILTLK